MKSSLSATHSDIHRVVVLDGRDDALNELKKYKQVLVDTGHFAALIQRVDDAVHCRGMLAGMNRC